MEVRKTIATNSPQETQQLAQKLIAKHLDELKSKCLIFALEGELGSGKTQFVKGLGKALKIKQTIRSPTFTLVHEHPFGYPASPKGMFYHVDAWRLSYPQEFLDLRLDKMIQPGNIIALEWADKAKSTLEKVTKGKKVKIIKLKFSHLNPKQRKIKITNED